MNPIPTKHIDGDVIVGRHVTAGGNATVRGSVKVGHDMKVEGWLDAPNIKGPNKGLFADVASLQAAYPRPEKGWWAAVGAGFPASVYIESNGSWIDSGKKWQPNISADSIVGDVENLKDRVENNESSISSLTETTTRTSKSLSDLSAKHQTDVEAMQSSITQIENQHQSDANGLRNSITQIENQHHADSNGLRSSIAQLEKSQQAQDATTASIKSELNATTAIVYKLDEAFYAFDGFCNGTAEAWKRLGAGIFYDQSAKRFAYHEAGAETADADDGSYGNELKGKCTYRCDGRLYRFVAGDLRAYVDQRITDQLSGEISRLESVSRHIMCFDGFVDTAEEVTSGEAIYFSIEDGVFVGDEQNSQSVDEINRTLTGGTIYLYDQNLYVFDGVERQLNRLCTIDEVRAALDAKAAILSDAIAEAKKALFIDEWNQMCCNGAIGANVEKIGGYNSETGYFELNGITDIDYYEALRIYQYALEYPNPTRIDNINIRTNLIKQSILSWNDLRPNIDSLFRSPKLLTCRVSTDKYGGCFATSAKSAFNACPVLHTVYGIVDLYYIADKGVLNPCNAAVENTALKNIKFSRLRQDFKLTQAPNLSLESMQYLINNAANTAPITIEVHPSMYAKLTGGSERYNLLKGANIEIVKDSYIMGKYDYENPESIKPGVNYIVTVCYKLGEKDERLYMSLTAGYGNDIGFDTRTADMIIGYVETKKILYKEIANAKDVYASFYHMPNDNDFDPNTKVLWAVVVPDDGSDTPITEWIPAISELPEDEQETAKWRQVNQLAAARGITFITAE